MIKNNNPQVDIDLNDKKITNVGFIEVNQLPEMGAIQHQNYMLIMLFLIV